MFDRILITGATGFVGTWVLRHWRETHPEVELWATGDVPEPAQGLWAHYRPVDLRDSAAVGDLIAECRPTAVIHLAGVIGSAPLDLCLAVNVMGTENLFQALTSNGLLPSVKVVQISSAAVYGLVRPDELPIREDQPLRPVSAYAVSKLAQDQLALAWHRREGLNISVARAFNLLGPDQPESLVPMAFLRQILAVRTGDANHVSVGNLTPTRDFVDIRDVAMALDTLLHDGQSGSIYNIGSGRDVSIQQVLDVLIGLHGSPLKVEVSTSRARATDVPEVRADIALIEAEFGWRPAWQLEQSLRSMWDQAVAIAI